MSVVGDARLRLYSGLSRCACSQRLWWRPITSRRQATHSIALANLHHHLRYSSSSSPLPKILQPSLWKSALPKFLRKRTEESDESTTAKKAAKPWNPATFFIVMSILIGSQAINTIALRNERDVFMRRADQRILALKEVINKVHEGVWLPDGPEVKKVLRRGLNDEPLTDEDWEATLKEIEEEELEWQTEAKKRRAVWEQEAYEKGLKEERKRRKGREKEQAELERQGPLPFDPPPYTPDYRTPPSSKKLPTSEDQPPKPPSGPRSAKDYFG